MTQNKYVMPAFAVGCFMAAAVAAKYVSDYQSNRIENMRSNWSSATMDQKFGSVAAGAAQIWCKDAATGTFTPQTPKDTNDLDKMLNRGNCVATADQGQIQLVAHSLDNIR